VAELALDHVHRHALARELHGVGVAQLVRREAGPDTRSAGEPARFDARVGTGPGPPAGRAVDDAEQRPDRELDSGDQPRSKLLPAPALHSDLAGRPPLPLRTSSDPRRGSRSRSPSSSASWMRSPPGQSTMISARSLKPCRSSPASRITATISSKLGGIELPLVAGRTSGVVAGHRRGRATPPGGTVMGSPPNRNNGRS
jgi:hypothetical protein